jgi:hypothetical protein
MAARPNASKQTMQLGGKKSLEMSVRRTFSVELGRTTILSGSLVAKHYGVRTLLVSHWD